MGYQLTLDSDLLELATGRQSLLPHSLFDDLGLNEFHAGEILLDFTRQFRLRLL